MTTQEQTEIKKISKKINSLISDTLADSILRNDNYSAKWVSKNGLPNLPTQEIPDDNLKTIDSSSAVALIVRIFYAYVIHGGFNTQGFQEAVINKDVIKFNKIGDLDVFDDREQTLINIRIKSEMNDCLHGFSSPHQDELSLFKEAKDWAASTLAKIPGMSDFRSEERVIFDKLQEYNNLWAQILKEHKIKEEKEKKIHLELDRQKKTSPHEYLYFDYEDDLATICQKLKEKFELIFTNINKGEIKDCNLIVDDDVHKSLNDVKVIFDKHHNNGMKHEDYIESIRSLRSKANLFCKQKIWVSSFEFGHYSDYSYDSWLCHWAKSKSADRINGLNYWQKSFFSIHWNIIFLCLISHQELFFLKAMKEFTAEDEKKLYADVKKCPPIKHTNEDYVKKYDIPIPERRDEVITQGKGGNKKKSRRNTLKRMKGGNQISFLDITNNGNFVFVDEKNCVTIFQIDFKHTAFEPLNTPIDSVEQSNGLTGCEKYYNEIDPMVGETRILKGKDAEINARVQKYIEKKGLECADFENSKEDRNTYLSLISIYETLGCDPEKLKTIIKIKDGLPQIKILRNVRKEISGEIISISEYEETEYEETEYEENVFISTKNETFTQNGSFFNLKTFYESEWDRSVFIKNDSEILHFEQINIKKTYYVVILNNTNPLILEWEIQKGLSIKAITILYNNKSEDKITSVDEVDEVNSFKIIYKDDKIYIIISSNKNSKVYMTLYIYTNESVNLDKSYILKDHDEIKNTEIKSIDFLINQNNVCYFICGDNTGKMYIGLYDLSEEKLLNKIIIDIHSSGDVKVWFFNDNTLICSLDSEGTLSYWEVKYNRAFKTLEYECIHRITGLPNKLICNPLYKSSLSQSMISYDNKNGITAWNIIDKNVVIPQKGKQQKEDFNHLCLADLDSDKNFTWVPDETGSFYNSFIDTYNRKEWDEMKSYNDEVNQLCGLLFLKNMDEESIRDLYILMLYTKIIMIELYGAVNNISTKEIDVSYKIQYFKESKNKKWIKLINSYIISEIKRMDFLNYLKSNAGAESNYIKMAYSPLIQMVWEYLRKGKGENLETALDLSESAINLIIKLGKGGHKKTKRRSKKSKKTRKTRRSK